MAKVRHRSQETREEWVQTSNKDGERSLDSLHFTTSTHKGGFLRGRVRAKVGYHLVFLVTIFVKKRDSLRSLTHFTLFLTFFKQSFS